MELKKKKSKKTLQKNPNQLNFEFQFREPSIDVHIPKSAATVFNTHFTNSRRLSIRLADN